MAPRVIHQRLPLASALGAAAVAATVACGGESRATTPQPTVPAVLFQEGFDDANLAARGWYDLPAGGIASIDTSQHVTGSTGSLLVNFALAGVTPSPPTAARHLFAPSDAVYVRYWIKHSANWVGSGKPYHPHLFSFVTTEDQAYVGPARTHLTTYVEENYQSGDLAVLGAQDGSNIDETRIGQDLTSVTESRASSGCNGNSDGYPTSCYLSGTLHVNGKTWTSGQPILQSSPGPGYQGDWHEVEAFYRLNTIVNGIGQLDGVAQYWVDGQLAIDLHNVLFRTGAHPDMKFNQFFMGPYIGDGSPVAQQLWVDDLVVMTGKP